MLSFTNHKERAVDKNEFYDAWQFIRDHPEFQNENAVPQLYYNLDIVVTKINPKTYRVDDIPEKNTDVIFLLEFGGRVCDADFGWLDEHDPRLDCLASSFEEAIIGLADKIKLYYGG
jgi:hypothetical protein